MIAFNISGTFFIISVVPLCSAVAKSAFLRIEALYFCVLTII